MKLTIELVPRSCWYSNLRQLVSAWQWDAIRKEVYEEHDNKCSICGGEPVEAHEIWAYKEGKQKLESIAALCPDCHSVKHIGLAQVNGKFDEAISHLMNINDMTKKEALAYVDECVALWRERSEKDWELDVGKYLD